MPNQPYPPPKTKKPVKGLWWKVAVPAVFLISLITAGIIYIVMLISPMATVTAAVNNLGKEFGQRMEGTPLESFGILFKSIESGSVTVDFHYSDRWEHTHGVIALHTDDINSEAVIEVDLTTNDFSFDLELYTNRERMAARISQIDNNFYGIKYDTFKEDFISFANLIGLDQHDIDMITELVEFYNDIMNNSADPASFYESYGKLIRNFIDRANISEKRVDFTSDGRSIRVKKIDLVISDRMIIRLLNDLIDLVENDDTIRAALDASDELQAGMYPYSSSQSFDEMMRELRSGVRDLERDLKGEIIVSFFVGSRNRLLRLEADIEFTYDREQIKVEMSLDLGVSAHDLWVYNINMHENNTSESTAFVWSIKETSRGGETSFSIRSIRQWGNEEFDLTLEWNERGNFTLSFRDAYSSEDLLSGLYRKINDGFELEIDDPFINSYWEESLQLKITVVNRSGHIKDITFINISDWGSDLLEKLEKLFIDDSYMQTPIPLPQPPGVIPGHPEHGTPLLPNPDLIDPDLVGTWMFSGGSVTYFFWDSEFVHFGEDGYVVADDEFGVWMIIYDQLYVTADFGAGATYVFDYEIYGNILYITDEDGDVGQFFKNP